MTKLTMEQIKHLNMYSVYVNAPEQKLFTLEDLLDDTTAADVLATVQIVSKCPNKTVAASYFSRRIGMFISMQFYQFTTYGEIWDSTSDRLTFGAKEEYGNLTVSLFANEEDWKYVKGESSATIIRKILTEQCDVVIRKIRSVANVSSLTLWENIFGFLLWQYHVLLENPATTDEARIHLNLLKDDILWEGIAPYSLFSAYLKGKEPSELLNTTVRTTCCLSKNVPGLMQCGFCPLK